jgi:SAM-dependent methyltransferase
VSRHSRCWCGNTDLLPFSTEYLRCAVCETLVLAERPDTPLGQVRDDEQDFYGRRYWFDHQEQDLGLSNLFTRVRQDLPERCLYWLRTLLAYKAPPARSLELGSSHGAFVALLRWTGFTAAGLEMSPWVADFARRTFDIPMYVGPIESQAIEPASLDVLLAMDVVEHLEDPLATITHGVSRLAPQGLLLLQTPCYPAGMTYDALVAAQSPFLSQLQAPEHTFLLSEQAMRELLRRAGIEHVRFEPAVFAHYDMFVAGSVQPFQPVEPATAEARLAESASGRLVQALLDLYADRAVLQRELAEESAHIRWLKSSIETLEQDRAARLSVLEDQGSRLGRIPSLEADIAHLKGLVHTAEADRAARLAVIERQGDQLGQIGSLEAQVAHFRRQVETMEADRAARLSIIELQRAELARIPRLDARLDELSEHSTRVTADLSTKDEIVQDQQRELRRLSSLLEGRQQDEQDTVAVREALVKSQMRCADLEREVAVLSRSRVRRLLRRVGFFR